MKKAAIIVLWVFMIRSVSAQYCGISGTSCSSIGLAENPGLYPPPDSFPSFYNNFLTSATIQFRNFDTILFGNEVLPVYSLKWDTIENLPSGLCWSANKTDNTFGRGEAGCIHINGLACGATGQYKLSTRVTVDIGVLVETDGDPGGLKYFVRLQNFGDTDIPVDTTQTDSMTFISYGGICQSLTPPVVNLGPDKTVCTGSVVTFDPAVTGGQPPYTYLWQSAGSNIICTTCANASVTVSQNSAYILKVTDASGGFGYDTVNYTVTGTLYNFQISGTLPLVFCSGGTATLSGNANNAVGFQWNKDGNSLADDTSNVLIVTDSSGAYNLVYTEAGVCQATSNIINILFYDTPVVTINSIGYDTICIGGDVTLVANAAGQGLTNVWLQDGSNANDSSASLQVFSSGTYAVVVTNLAGCSDTTAILIAASPNFPTPLSYTQFTNDTLCNNAATIVLSGGEPTGGYYTGTGVSNDLFDPNAARNGLNLIYYNYVDSTGCSSSVYDTIVVLLCTGEETIYTENYIRLYPNPVTDILTIQSEALSSRDAKITFFDITGKELFLNCERRNNNMVSVNVSALAAGCYLVSIEGESACHRFIKIE